jgi:hypothetical protein
MAALKGRIRPWQFAATERESDRRVRGAREPSVDHCLSAESQGYRRSPKGYRALSVRHGTRR